MHINRHHLLHSTIVETALLSLGISLETRKVSRDGLQQTDHTATLVGHATIGTRHGLRNSGITKHEKRQRKKWMMG